MSETSHQDLSGVAETLLITLHLRAMESQRPDALIKDEKAVTLVRQMSYDFSWIRQIPMSEVNKVTLILRNREFDRYTRDFLARRPKAVAVHIGCGFDTRFERVDNGQVEWYDLDLPDVIELRRKLIGDEGGRYHLLGCSALDNAWLEALSAHRQRPFLFLAEGVFMYFEEAQVKSLVLVLRDHFPGAELVFDAFSPLHVWRSNLQISIARLSARFPRLHWGLWRGQEIEGWGDGIHLLDEWGYLDRPEPRLAHIRWARHIPFVARAGCLYHFRLGKAAGRRGLLFAGKELRSWYFYRTCWPPHPPPPPQLASPEHPCYTPSNRNPRPSGSGVGEEPMTSAGPEPQIEYVRELIVTGDLGPLNALLDLEAGLSTDQTFRQVRRITLTLFGPIVRGTSTYWLIHDGCHPVLSSYRCSRERTLIDFDPFHFSVSPDATLQQVYDQIAASDVDPCHVLRVGLLRAIPLPHDRLRLFFAVAGFETPSLFWLLVDGLTAELHRLGFRSVDLGQPSPDTAPPEPDPGAPSLPGKPEEPQRSDPLDLWFDWRASCRAISYWVTLRDIAARTSYSLDTIKKKHALYMAEHRLQNKAPKSTK